MLKGLMTYRLKLKKAEQLKLEGLLINERDTKIWRRLKCIELKNEGHPCQEIAKLLDVTLDTITNWVRQYLDEGLKGLCELKYADRRPSQLAPYANEIKAYIQTGPLSNLGELSQWVKEQFKIECSPNWMGKWLKKSSMFPIKKRG